VDSTQKPATGDTAADQARGRCHHRPVWWRADSASKTPFPPPCPGQEGGGV